MELIQFYYDNIIDAAWVIELFLLASAWVILCGTAKKTWEWIVHTLCLFLAMAVANVVLFCIMQGINNFFIVFWGYTHGVISAIYLWRYSPYHKKTWALLWLALYNSILAIAALSGQCSALFGTYVMRGPIEGVIRCCVYVLMPLVALYLRRYKFDEFPVVPKSGMYLVGVLCICVQLLGIVEAYFFEAGSSIQFVLLFVYACMVMTSIAAIQAMYTMCAEQRDISNLELENQKYLADQEMGHLAEKTLEDLRFIRHDIKNQFAYCTILLEQERYDELKEYFAQFRDHLPPQLQFIDCGNRTVNTVLNIEFSKIREKGVTIEQQLVVPPVLPFRDEEISAIIFNLLDNALEECVKLQKRGRENTKIRLEIYPYQSYLYICCKNSTDRKSITHQGMGLRSTKTDKSLHGYGTRIISKLAEQNNGCAEFKLDGGMFVASVMLDIIGGISNENEHSTV